MKIGAGSLVYESDVEVLKFPWGTIRMLSRPEITGAPDLSFGVVESLPGGGHERHNHPGSDEIIYLVSGQCELMLDDQPPLRIKPGACIHIPAGVYHYTANVGADSMITLIAYSPAGPEEVLRESPTCKVVPCNGSPVQTPV
jgi:oxalate decarboxylase/phosphoglucose isomerase-like protein (cupin superfamily)